MVVKKLRSKIGEPPLSELKGGTRKIKPPVLACYIGRPPPGIEASPKGIEVLLKQEPLGLYRKPASYILLPFHICSLVSNLLHLSKRTFHHAV